MAIGVVLVWPAPPPPPPSPCAEPESRAAALVQLLDRARRPAPPPALRDTARRIHDVALQLADDGAACPHAVPAAGDVTATLSSLAEALAGGGDEAGAAEVRAWTSEVGTRLATMGP